MSMEKMKRPCNFWLDYEEDKMIDNAKIKYNLKSRGEVVRYYLKVGDIFLKNMEAIKANPETLDKAMIEIDELRKQEMFGLYLESMTKEQREAVVGMCQMINEGTWKQTRLVGMMISLK